MVSGDARVSGDSCSGTRPLPVSLGSDIMLSHSGAPICLQTLQTVDFSLEIFCAFCKPSLKGLLCFSMGLVKPQTTNWFHLRVNLLVWLVAPESQSGSRGGGYLKGGVDMFSCPKDVLLASV